MTDDADDNAFYCMACNKSFHSPLYSIKGSGKRAYIGVVRETGKAPYLRTYADGKWNDNLLAQTECGTSCKVVS